MCEHVWLSALGLQTCLACHLYMCGGFLGDWCDESKAKAKILFVDELFTCVLTEQNTFTGSLPKTLCLKQTKNKSEK